MSFTKIFKKGVTAISAFGISSVLLVSAADGQQMSYRLDVAAGNNLYCAGYVQTSPIDTSRTVIGGFNEQDGFLYAENDEIYVNAGANRGVKEGDLMSVVRPRGQVSTRWSNKNGLGFYVQEVGVVEVVRVKTEYSIVRAKTSCDTFLLGDLVRPYQERTSPEYAKRAELDRFADPSGKARGRVFMARDNQQMVTRDQIVYVDLGAEDNVRAGDYLTFYRPLGKGNLFHGPPESASARSYGYSSLTYRGGKFSNQTPRKSGEQARGRVVTSQKAKEGRPEIRKVVGEGMIVNVKERTATVVITRTVQEIHTGDWVEVQ